MRYFSTTNASRQYEVGGRLFTFEPTVNFGGAWSGVLAVADEATASSLADAKIPQIRELSYEEFEAEKKRPLNSSSSSYPRQQPQEPLPLRKADVQPAAEEPPASPSSATSTEATDASSDANEQVIDLGLEATTDEPPAELPDETPAVKPVSARRGKKTSA